MPNPPVTPRDAATLVLLRAGAGVGLQVLMLRRHVRIEFAGDMWVFPGGVVDATDRSLDPARWEGIDPHALAPRFAEPADLVLGYHVAAVRETFEEAGLLLARREDGGEVNPAAPSARGVRALLSDRHRHADWFRWLEAEGLVLDLGGLAYLARWVTPAQSPKRYDTCFFVAATPDRQVADHDRAETTDQRWLAPADALARAEAGEMPMMTPTEWMLRHLAAFDAVDAVLAHARAQREIRRIQPHVEKGSDGRRVVHPDDPDYPHERYAPGGDLAPGGGPSGGARNPQDARP